ncbi:OmpA family protein [Paraglaciecola sp. 2405UD69-4]|uniref:OmpA family protein n=1 Tax=Paraglaciecola sp. 2405UD69-4 TaxID=3391836 RepID=UPI0039C95958
MPEKNAASSQESQQQMQALRQIILGDDGQYVTEKIQQNARELVSEVLSEALHDREKQDGSVNTVLLPLVEKSVETSITNHSQQFVGYLYPIVGSLVRKSVTAFITEFLEKTNTLLENSFTVKGLKWRFKAWQAGVSFSQYAASQTFAFRVEQVFLIHSETGLLLNSVSYGLDTGTGTDADLMSSMLTAINDFVSDSFRPNQDSSEQHLNVIRTNDFTLLIKPGPKAVVVASITGNMPQGVANQLQKTLEEIHKLYDKELSEFNGDTLPFEHSQNQLRTCLVSELKPEHQGKKKKPWFAWLLVTLIIICLGYLLGKHWQASVLLDKVRQVDNEPGIFVTQADTKGLSKVEIEILRDPAALSIEDWLEQQNIEPQKLHIKERAFLSLEPEVIKLKVQGIVEQYPKINVSWTGEKPKFSGKLSINEHASLKQGLQSIVGLDFKSTWLDKLDILAPQNIEADNPLLLKNVLDIKIARINQTKIAFNNGESDLPENALDTLTMVAQQLKELETLAQKLNLSLSLIIMGTSDPTGTANYNRALSQLRADNVKFKLHQLGIDENRLNAIGLGVIDLSTSPKDARMVLLNVVYFTADNHVKNNLE